MPNVDDVRGHLLAQDVIWVGGGSVANLLALWRLHGWDELPAARPGRPAWCSAGCPPARSAGTTAAPPTRSGRTLRPVTNGLGFLPYSNGVHYNSEQQRRPLFHRLIADGTLTAGYATDDGVGLVYRGTEMVEAVADRPGLLGVPGGARADGIAVENRHRAAVAALSLSGRAGSGALDSARRRVRVAEGSRLESGQVSKASGVRIPPPPPALAR